MGNLDLDQALNPWMFDKSGDLTPEAKKQFPDLGSSPAPISTGATMCVADGRSVVVNPAALKSAGDNATQLGNKMTAECQTPVGDDLFTAASAMGGSWSLGPAITNAHTVWENQFLNLGGNLITIGSNLHDTATGYHNTETGNRGRMQAIQ